MRTINEDMHAWSLDEIIDQEIGKVGTPARAEFDAKVEEKVRKIEVKKRKQAEKASMHIIVPVAVRDAIHRNAEALGESANTYVNNIFSQAINSAAYA